MDKETKKTIKRCIFFPVFRHKCHLTLIPHIFFGEEKEKRGDFTPILRHHRRRRRRKRRRRTKSRLHDSSSLFQDIIFRLVFSSNIFTKKMSKNGKCCSSCYLWTKSEQIVLVSCIEQQYFFISSNTPLANFETCSCFRTKKMSKLALELRQKIQDKTSEAPEKHF